MLGVNKVIVMGHITRDPELKYTPNGQSVTSFGVATNRRWNTPEGEKREEVEFHNIVSWGRQGEVISQYLKKGSPIYIEGRLKTQSWEGSDGIKRSRTEVIVESFQFIGGPNQGQGGQSGYQAPAQSGYGVNQNNNQGNNNFTGPNNPNANNSDHSPEMSSPAMNAQNDNTPPADNQGNSPSADSGDNQNPFSNDNNESKPNIGNPDDISIDDIPF